MQAARIALSVDVVRAAPKSGAQYGIGEIVEVETLSGRRYFNPAFFR